MRYLIAVNRYRSSTCDGFANTWQVYQCRDRAQQRRILRDGLPVRDVRSMDGKPCYSTKGIRTVTAQERRIEYVPMIDDEFDTLDWD